MKTEDARAYLAANQPLPRDSAFSEEAVEQLEAFTEFIDNLDAMPDDFPELFVGFVGGFDGLGFFDSLQDAVLRHCAPGSFLGMIAQLDDQLLQSHYAGQWLIGVLSDQANGEAHQVTRVLISRFKSLHPATKRLALALCGRLCGEADIDDIAALGDGEPEQVATKVAEVVEQIRSR